MECKICNCSADNQLFEFKERMFGTNQAFEYLQCSQCGCMQILNIPKDMSPYYPVNYYSFITTEGNRVNKISAWLKNIRDRYAIFNTGFVGRVLFSIMPNYTLRCLSKINITYKSKILDIGCGSGLFLHRLSELGFVNLLGIDPYLNSDINYSNGLKIEKKDFFKQTGKWDIIMLHHSLEHIPNQEETLRRIADLLESGGVCIIRVPVFPSYAWEKYKDKWVQLDAPRHLFIHTIGSMRLLSEKVNLKLTDVVYDSNELQFIGSEQYLKGITLRDSKSYYVNPSASVFTRAEIREFKRKAQVLNKEKKGDQAIFYLSK